MPNESATPQPERPNSHEEREAQTVVERIEKKVEASQESARVAETKRTLDDYMKKVGS
jgi:hypothetical protein